MTFPPPPLHGHSPQPPPYVQPGQQPPPYVQPGYPQPGPYGFAGPVPGGPPVDDPGKTLGVWGIVLAFVPPIVGPVTGIVLSAVSRSKSKRAGHQPTLGTIGLALSIIMLLLSLGALGRLGTMAVNSSPNEQFCQVAARGDADMASAGTPDLAHPRAYVEGVRRTSADFASLHNPPPGIVDDWMTMAADYATIARGFDGIDEDDPVQFSAALQAVQRKLQPDLPRLRAASAHLLAYSQQVCG